MRHIRWPAVCDPNCLCGALLRVAVLDEYRQPSPLDPVDERLRYWNTLPEIRRFPETSTAGEKN